MARIKISEYNAKSIVCPALSIPWKGLRVDTTVSPKAISDFFSDTSLVIKVDQGIKKRGKLGLLKVGVSAEEALRFLQSFSLKSQGKLFDQFLIEETVMHKPEEEHYVSIERVREEMRVLYSAHGGVDIEDNLGDMEEVVVPHDKFSIQNKPHLNPPLIGEVGIAPPLLASPRRGGRLRQLADDWGGVVSKLVERLIVIMDENHFSFLEINPLVIKDKKISILDLAIEADDAASRIEKIEEINSHPAEIAVATLQENTPASLKLKIINPNGRIWMLLSGGGASLVLSDEVADRGYGAELANYGEYSGSPSTEDTYLYTKILLQTMLVSPAKNKVLIIAGGVANFTDVVKTFKGIIQALNEYKVDLSNQGIKVFVRRGGPNQEKGLKQMKEFLEKNGLYGSVSGSEEELTEVITKFTIFNFQAPNKY